MTENAENKDARPNSAQKWPADNLAQKWPGDYDADTARLNSLQEKVWAVQAEDAAEEAAAFDPARPRTSMGLGLKLGVDLVVATGIGVALGFGLDLFFGTSPWLLLLFICLGFAAGIRMVIASADDYRQRIENSGEPEQGEDGAQGLDDDAPKA